MNFRLLSLAFAVSTSFALANTPALAHPHVWVTVKSELVYAPDGAITGVRHAWTFDDMYSSYAIQGIEAKQKGSYTRDELAPIATENITSMKESDYFTFVNADGKKTAMGDPVDYWLEYKDEMLTLYFLLPLATPTKTRDLKLEVFDPEFFIDFELAAADPVRLAGAPAMCKLAATSRPDPSAPAQIQRLAEAARSQQGSYGSVFANKIAVSCP